MADNKTEVATIATSDNMKKIVVVSENAFSVEQEQLLILQDISAIVKNLSEKMLAKPKSNVLAEKEKERESKLADKVKEDKQKFEMPFKGILNAIKLILTPMILGFIVGFRKKFDLLTLAIYAAVMNPIASLLALWKLLKLGFDKVFNLLKTTDLYKMVRTKFLGAITGLLMPISKLIQTVKNELIFAKLDKALGRTISFTRRVLLMADSAISKAGAVITATKNFFAPLVDFIKVLTEPFQALFKAGTKIKGLMNNKVFGWIARIGSKGLKAIPVIGWVITIIEGLFGAVTGGMEGFKKDGFTGMIRGALVGLVDGLVGWIVGLGQWIVSSLLDLFGFEDAAKIVEGFDFKKFVDKYAAFLFPIVALMDLFDENSEIRKNLSKSLESLKNAGSFMMDILDTVVETIKEILINIGKSIPGGEWLLDKLGVNQEEPTNITKNNFTIAKEAAVQKAIEEGKSEEEIQAIRSAKNTDELRAATPATTGDRLKAMAMNPFSWNLATMPIAMSYSIRNAQSDEIKAAEASVVPAPSPQQRNQQAMNAQTQQNKDLAAAPPKAPVPVSSTTVAVDRSSKQSVTYNRELHAAKDRGSPNSTRASPY